MVWYADGSLKSPVVSCIETGGETAKGTTFDSPRRSAILSVPNVLATVVPCCLYCHGQPNCTHRDQCVCGTAS